MANILVGDVHGCYEQLRRLLDKAHFDPTYDTLWLTGDLVAKGPHSLKVLEYAKSLNNKIRLTLGNHDLHLLAVYAGIHQSKREELVQIIKSPKVNEIMHWLRKQPVMQINKQLQLIMVHAGISPQWDLATAEQCARELQSVLSGNNYITFLKEMYGNKPNYWSPKLQGIERLRYIANVFTRMRYCHPDGSLEFNCKLAPKYAPNSIKPWFTLPRKIPLEYSIVFGHWASLKGKGTPTAIYGLDTGCYWGGKLTALRFEDKHRFTESCTCIHKNMNDA